MNYATLNDYIKTIENLKVNLKSSKNIIPLRDTNEKNNPPLYRVKKGVVLFSMMDDNQQNYLLVLFLNKEAQEKFCDKYPKIKILIAELFVETASKNSIWVDIAIIKDKKNTPKITEPQRDFIEGLQPFKTKNKWGFRDKENKTIIEPKWDSVEDFCEGRAVVETDDLYGVLDNQDNVIAQPIYNELAWYGSQFIYAEIDGQWGVIDRCGKTILDFEWDWISSFEYGYATVEKDNKYGFVNDKGVVIIEPKYEEASKFNEFGSACVTLNEKSFFIDHLERRV